MNIFEETQRITNSENFIINFEGDTHVLTEGVAFTSSSESFCVGQKEYNKGDGIKSVYNIDTKIKVDQHISLFDDVIVQYNTVINKGDDTKILTNISSAMFAIPYKGLIAWNDKRRFKLHICKSAWSAEAQWHSGSLADFGLNPIRHFEKGIQGPGRIILQSKGSWSTGTYYPLVILEDLEKGKTYFMEHEGGLSWKIVIGIENDNLVFDCGSADIHINGFCKKLENLHNLVHS